MKHLAYVYCNIYNYCQQRNNSLSSLPARIQAMYIVSLSAGGWVLFMQALFLRLVRRAWFSSHAVAMSSAILIYLCTALLFYRLLIINNYDEKMYNKYESSGISDLDKQRGPFLAAFITVSPYLLLIALKLLFQRQH